MKEQIDKWIDKWINVRRQRNERDENRHRRLAASAKRGFNICVMDKQTKQRLINRQSHDLLQMTEDAHEKAVTLVDDPSVGPSLWDAIVKSAHVCSPPHIRPQRYRNPGLLFYSHATQLYTLLCRSVGRSVSWSVGRLVPFLLFRRFWAFWAYGSCPDALVTFSSTAPAHPHATRVAVYPALFSLE